MHTFTCVRRDECNQVLIHSLLYTIYSGAYLSALGMVYSSMITLLNVLLIFLMVPSC